MQNPYSKLVGQGSSKIGMKLQRFKIAELVLKKAKTRGFTLSDIKTNYQTVLFGM